MMQCFLCISIIVVVIVILVYRCHYHYTTNSTTTSTITITITIIMPIVMAEVRDVQVRHFNDPINMAVGLLRTDKPNVKSAHAFKSGRSKINEGPPEGNRISK